MVNFNPKPNPRGFSLPDSVNSSHYERKRYKKVKQMQQSGFKTKPFSKSMIRGIKSSRTMAPSTPSQILLTP